MRGPVRDSVVGAEEAWDDLPRRKDAEAQKARAERLAAYVRADLARRKAEAVARALEGAAGYREADRVAQDALARVLSATGDILPGDLGETSQ